MIKSIQIGNFKCFNSLTGYQEIGDVNLFCGKNSSGKSSFLQPLLAMAQSVILNPSTKELKLNGSFISLGENSKVFNKEKNEDDILKIGFQVGKENLSANIIYSFKAVKSAVELDSLELLSVSISGKDIDGENYGLHEFKLTSETKNNEESILICYPPEVIGNNLEFKTSDGLYNFLPRNLPELKKGFNAFLQRLHGIFDLQSLFYISANRLGPTEIQKIDRSRKMLFNPNGSNSLSYLKRYFSTPINKDLIFDTKKGISFERQLSAWIEYIFDSEFSSTDAGTGYAQTFFEDFSSQNVGFGLSYALPIILLSLAPIQKDLIIIENPEAHLEPSAQFKLIELILKSSKTGTQFLIETHSDVIVNAIRLKAEELKSENPNYKIYFAEKTSKYHTLIRLIGLDKDAVWPKGFFDQSDMILSKLYGI